MKFKMNDREWEIKEISDEEMSIKEGYDTTEEFVHGITKYSENRIYINSATPNKEKTLYHELVHCYTYEYGLNPFNKKFTIEDVCEICACSHEIIDKIVKEYFKDVREAGRR